MALHNVRGTICLRWRAPVMLLVCLLALLMPAVAAAHPLGNFTISRYSRLEPQRERIRLLYVVDMAEVPAFQELRLLDTNGDGAASPVELAGYAQRRAGELLGGLRLSAGEQSLALVLSSAEAELAPGQGGLQTLRLTLQAEASLAATDLAALFRYRDDNFAGRPGWQEIIVRGGPGISLRESSVPQQDLSDTLRRYPDDLLQSPPQVTEAYFRAGPGAPGAASAPAGAPAPAAVAPAKGEDALTRLISDSTGPWTILAALVIALGMGAVHALAPGHGKTIVAAYLVGARGAARHAIFLGLTTTITHTLGVFLLGGATLLLSAFVLPEQLYPWLGVISGAMVFAIGLALLRARLRPASNDPHLHDHGFGPHSHSHSHDHDHDHHHSHDHDHHHSHDHNHTDHSSPITHHPPLSWRGLLALGISGGLIPCPSALVVMLGAIALGRPGLGLLLVAAFSLGLAAVLTGIGLLLVYARQLFERLPVRSSLLTRGLPAASAALVTLLGAAITVQALAQTGILKL